jgi:hypothetical protein
MTREQEKRVEKLESALRPPREEGEPWSRRPNAEEAARKIDALIVEIFGEDAPKYEPEPLLPGESLMDGVIRRACERAGIPWEPPKDRGPETNVR